MNRFPKSNLCAALFFAHLRPFFFIFLFFVASTFSPHSRGGPLLQDGEALEEGITDIYQRVLDRAPDPEGLRTWKSKARNGATLKTIEAEIKGSKEAREKDGVGRILDGTASPPAPSYDDPYGYEEFNKTNQ